ncbi:hypothetical protein ACIOJD_02960 [Streptomyces sp. NPDC088116]|uniref:hypothetical protein n=1 Tax=Streptomyces sp. NPDC088116 TaxID=3365825 RepID=UPI003807BA7D
MTTPAPTSPGPWDPRSQALLPDEAPAATPSPPVAPLPTSARQPSARHPLAGKPLARKPAARRGPADPVKALMHRHRRLCERAVHPLEIAAGLEAHGITDRTAARFRHRDVFSLAEELYARVPEGTDRTTAERPARTPAPTRAGRAGWSSRADWTGWAALASLPGVVGCLTLVGLEHSGGQRQLATGLAGALALSGALCACLRRGPLRAEGRAVPAGGLWVYWLLAYLLCGDGLLDQLVSGGPDGPWPATLTPLLALAFAMVPGAWCAHLFSVLARRRLAASRGLADFSAGARPLLLTLVGLYVCVLTGLSLLAALAFEDDDGVGGGTATTVTLGTLFLLARLLTVYGRPKAAAFGLAGACAVEALSCLSVPAGRLPGCDVLAAPVEAVIRTWGVGGVPALACGAAAIGLLIHAAVALSRASAHT